MRARIAVLMATILTAVACARDITMPPLITHVPIQWTLGNNQADTVQATLASTIVVRVGYGPHGESGANQIVRFQPVLDSGTYRVLIEPLAGGGNPSTFVAETTDATGETGVVVVLGTTAGPARIAASVPAFGYVDTALVTVEPGSPTGMQAAPHDTTAYIGDSVALRTAVVDRFGNKRGDRVTFVIASGPGTLHGRTVGVTGYGPVQVVGSADLQFTDTTTVYGVPTGVIAASGDATGIFTFNLDGSNFTQISSGFAGTLKWAPNGQSLAFDQTVDGLYGATDLLQTVQLNGQLATIVNSGSTALAYPQYSRDGQWIYYNEYSVGQPLWRVHADGTGDSSVFMASPEGLQFPSPSPDGSKVSYILTSAGNLKVLTLSTGAAVDLGVRGVADNWSPTGNVIAYVTLSGSLATINSDGSAPTTIAPGPYGPQFDWSPDGHWIIARNTATSRLELVEVATQSVIPLGYTGTIGSPTWH